MSSTSESDLDFVSRVSGVDFLALREKYKKSSSASEDKKSEPTNPADSSEDKLGKKNVNETLSAYNICKACNGLGIVKRIYNHMVLESTCEECDGDSLVQSRLDKAVESTHPIDDR